MTKYVPEVHNFVTPQGYGVEITDARLNPAGSFMALKYTTPSERGNAVFHLHVPISQLTPLPEVNEPLVLRASKEFNGRQAGVAKEILTTVLDSCLAEKRPIGVRKITRGIPHEHLSFIVRAALMQHATTEFKDSNIVPATNAQKLKHELKRR